MADKPRGQRGRKDYDEKFSLHPLSFEQAAQALLKVPPLDEPVPPRGKVIGQFTADTEELQRLGRELSNGLFKDPPNNERLMNAEDIQEYIEDEGYRHGR